MLFSKPLPEKLTLVLDIQSSVVRGSLVVIAPGVIPRVVFTYSADIAYKTPTDNDYLIKTTLSAVTENIQAAVRHVRLAAANRKSGLPRKISAVEYVLSSPWIVSQAKILSIPFEKSTTVTREFIKSIIDKELSKLVASPTEAIQVIEQKIFDVRLNGYSVANWEGKETKELQVSFTISVAGRKMIEYFIAECRHLVRASHVSFHSCLLLQYIGIEKVHTTGQYYSLVHIHGEQTDISIIRDQSCIFFGSFAFGVKTVVRKIALATHNDEKAADSLLTLYTGGKLDESHGRNVIETIDKILDDWASDLRKLLADSEFKITTPMSVILSAWAHDDCFLKALEIQNPGISISLLSIENLISHVAFDPHTERRRLTALYAIALSSFSNK